MLINIQFLRFAAAMLVVFYHTSAQVRATGVDQGWFFALSEAVGFAGVDVFFVISGFIMAHTTRSDSGAGSAWSFFRRRLARIYSGYWPFFLLALAVFAWVNPAQLQNSSLVRSAILWPANVLLIAVSWTLIFEMFFYVLYAGLLVLSPTRREFLLKLMLVFILGWSVYSQFVRHAYDQGQLESISLSEYYVLSPYLAEFLAGAIAASWLFRGSRTQPWIWLTAGIALFLLGGWINNGFFNGDIEQGYFVVFRVLVFGVPALCLLIGLVQMELAEVQAPLRFSLLAGGASYAIYLSHTLILTLTQHLGFNRFASQLLPDWAPLLFIGLALLILVYSMIHFRLLERPLHKLFKRALQIS